jgi:hypothetical protein
LAATQLARYLADEATDADADDAVRTPTRVTRRHVEAFQAFMVESRSAATADPRLNCRTNHIGKASA